MSNYSRIRTKHTAESARRTLRAGVLTIGMVALIAANVSAQRSGVHNSGQLSYRHQERQNGRDVDITFAWQLNGPPRGSAADGSVVGRGLAPDSVYLSQTLRFSYGSNSLYVDGTAYPAQDYSDVVSDLYLYSITFQFDLVSMSNSTRRWTVERSEIAVGDEARDYNTSPIFLDRSTALSQEELYTIMRTEGLTIANLRVTSMQWGRGLAEARREVERRERAAAQAAEADARAAQEEERGNPGDSSPRSGVASAQPSRQAATARTPQQSTQRSYSPPAQQAPPPPPPVDWNQQFNEFVARDAQQRAEITAAVNEFFNEINEMQRAAQRQRDAQRRWNAAANLETSGQSPEAMIRQVEQKRRELQQLAAERREEHRLEMEEFEREAMEAAREAQSAEAAVAGAIIGAAGRVVGAATIEAQRQRAERELEQQLTEAFQAIQNDVRSDIRRNTDTARRGQAQTLFPEEFDYFAQVISYYEQYDQQVVSGFSIRDTDWMYPPGREPSPPRLAARPTYNAASIAAFMDAKWRLIDSGAPYGSEARETLDFLTAYGMDQFSNRPEPYYYRSLITADQLDRYLLSRRARELSTAQQYRAAEQRDFSALQVAFFDALTANRRQMIRRVWDAGLVGRMRSAAGDNAYIHALRRNVAALDTLMGLHDAGDRRALAQNLLNVAAGEGIAAGVPVLIQRGAQPNVRDAATGMTPILAGASGGHIAVIDVLSRRHGVNAQEALADAHARGMTAARFHVARYLIGVAVAADDPARMGDAVRLVPAAVHADRGDGSSYLAGAVRADRRRMLAALFGVGVDPNAANRDGTPMVAVAMAAGVEDATVRTLVDAGANLETPGEGGKTLLHWAIVEDRRDLVSYLLEAGAPTDLGDNRQRVALHYAAEELDGAEFTAVLRATGVVDYQDAQGDTPLHLALARGHAPVARELLSYRPIPDLQNGAGESYLHPAVRALPELVPELLALPVPLHLADAAGNTALHLAVREEFAFWPALADPTVVHQADTHGDTPVHLMLRNEWRIAHQFLAADSGGPVIANGEGLTYLHEAARLGDRTLVAAALATGVPVDAADATGSTALHYAAERGALDVVAFLLEEGANPELTNEAGSNARTLARAADHRETEQFIRAYQRRPALYRRIAGEDQR